MLSSPVAQPKAKADPRRRTRLHKTRMREFVNNVWALFGAVTWRHTICDQMAPCEGCGKTVFRRSSPFGAVDHIKPRSTCPEEKYNPSNGKLVCERCHNEKHGWKVVRQ